MRADPLDGLVSLHRYFIWANRMRTHFDQLLESGRYTSPPGDIEGRLYLSYWYAALYVVVEGWQALSLSDSTIDQLLQSPNVPLLKRYRNGTFHFQHRYNDRRFIELLEKGSNVVEWVRELNEEFGRYFLQALKGQPV